MDKHSVVQHRLMVAKLAGHRERPHAQRPHVAEGHRRVIGQKNAWPSKPAVIIIMKMMATEVAVNSQTSRSVTGLFSFGRMGM
jgi:hypothetical protein